MGEEDADYAMRIHNMIKLFGKPIKVNKASANEKNLDVGANLFVGNLDPEVDEKLLFDTFSAFGVILQVSNLIYKISQVKIKHFRYQKLCVIWILEIQKDMHLSISHHLRHPMLRLKL